jgi:hypothetical protein
MTHENISETVQECNYLSDGGAEKTKPENTTTFGGCLGASPLDSWNGETNCRLELRMGTFVQGSALDESKSGNRRTCTLR